MAIPGENYVLRLHETEGTLIDMNVLDLAVTGTTERAALVEWTFGTRGAPNMAGFSILSFDPLGNVLGQISKTLCSFSDFECGNFRLETGTLLPMFDGFLIAGTATDIFSSVQTPIAIRLDTAGIIRWAHKYTADLGHPSTAMITSIVPLQTPDRFLISAISSDDDTWLFQIDGVSGAITDSSLVSDTHIRRLRMTSLGVLAVGEVVPFGGPPNVEPVVIAYDSMTAAPLWMRTYTWPNEGGDIGVRWLDIAEGSDVLLVAGNVADHLGELSPMMASLDKASLPTPGDIIKVVVPTLGDSPVRLRAVINRQDLEIPLKGAAVFSAFCVTGDANNQPWSFAIKDDLTLLWQKQLRVLAGSQGREVPVIWPSYEEIISGGFVTTGSTPRGFIASSAVTNGRGVSTCSVETEVAFPEGTLFAHRPLPEADPLNMQTLDWFLDQGTDLQVLRGCLDIQ